MDGFARPVAGTPQGQPGVRPQPRPAVRTVAAPPRPQPQSQPQPVQRPVPAQGSQQPPQPKPVRKRGGAWRVVLQFIVGLLVIVGVAAAIVLLYVRYYQ
jgi:hypothetical protein